MRATAVAVVCSATLLAIGCTAAPPWIDDGLTMSIPGGPVASGPGVSALLSNNTGGRIKFGPPGCGPIQRLTGAEWQTIQSTVGRPCEEVVISLDNGKSFPFDFEVPAASGTYRLVSGVVTADNTQIRVYSVPVTVK